MKVARLAVLGVALAAGGGAAYYMSGNKPPSVQMISAPALETEDVLVAARDLQMGTLVTEADLAWQPWPAKALSPLVLTKSAMPGAVEDIKGSVSRANFVQGEPIRKEKLAKGPNSGYLSAIVASGLRAVAINIESGGSTSAGGFILPNDHVDVVRTFRDVIASKTAEAMGAQTLATNVRVLAIGQNIQEKNGERVVVGANATLELNPAQAETIILAQRTGQLWLVLRAMVDSTQPMTMTRPLNSVEDNDDGQALTIVRFGVPGAGNSP